MKKLKGFNARLAKMGGDRPKAVSAAARPEAKSTPALMMDLMLAALRVSDERLNTIAAELIVRCGEEPVRRLCLMAVDRKNSPRHRVRLLGVIERIGTVADPADFMDLFGLICDENAEVRAAARKLVETLRQRGNGPAAP